MTTEAFYRPQGRLDGSHAAAHESELRGLLSGEVRSLTIDLSDVVYIGSAGLRVLLIAAKSTRAKGGKVRLLSPRPAVAATLQLGGFGSLFEIPAAQAAEAAAPSTGAEPATETAGAGPVRLTLAEELMLLALDDQSGTVIGLASYALELGVAAALVMELTLEGRIDSDLEKLILLSHLPIGNPLLDETLAEIGDGPASQPVRFWLARLSQPGPVLVERVTRSLVDRGVLRRVEKRLLWVFKTRVYPPTSGLEEREVKSRLLSLLGNDDIPDPRDALLVGLLRATGLIDQLLGESERARLHDRIGLIANLEDTSRELSRTLQELRQLLATMDKLEGARR